MSVPVRLVGALQARKLWSLETARRKEAQAAAAAAAAFDPGIPLRPSSGDPLLTGVAGSGGKPAVAAAPTALRNLNAHRLRTLQPGEEASLAGLEGLPRDAEAAAAPEVPQQPPPPRAQQPPDRGPRRERSQPPRDSYDCMEGLPSPPQPPQHGSSAVAGGGGGGGLSREPSGAVAISMPAPTAAASAGAERSVRRGGSFAAEHFGSQPLRAAAAEVLSAVSASLRAFNELVGGGVDIDQRWRI